MKSKVIVYLFAAMLAPFSLCAAQGITLESVEGMYGPAEDSMLVADGATQIVFHLRLTGLNEVCGGFTAGLRVYSADGAEWGGADADTLDVGIPWGHMFDSCGGFYENHFSVTGSGADTIGLGALAIFNGLPADFDAEAFTLTIGPISPSQDGRTICLDSSFYPPNGYWVMAGAGGSFNWGGPYHFTLANPTAVIDGGESLPKQFALSQNYPNPFNPTTEVLFDVPYRSHVRIAIYNVLGQKVRTLVDEELAAGTYMRTWDGRSDNGESISSGVYLYRMEAGEFVTARKMMMLK